MPTDGMPFDRLGVAAWDHPLWVVLGHGLTSFGVGRPCLDTQSALRRTRFAGRRRGLPDHPPAQRRVVGRRGRLRCARGLPRLLVSRSHRRGLCAARPVHGGAGLDGPPLAVIRRAAPGRCRLHRRTRLLQPRDAAADGPPSCDLRRGEEPAHPGPARATGMAGVAHRGWGVRPWFPALAGSVRTNGPRGRVSDDGGDGDRVPVARPAVAGTRRLDPAGERG